MQKVEGPSFTIGTDTILSGEEAGFSKCKSFQDKYLAGISARVEAVVYAYSEKWGHVVRSYYKTRRQPAGVVEEGTLVCWRENDSDEVKFLVDIEGRLSDLTSKPQ